ncbi:hypothetical protein PSA5_10205 [Pseudomonas syringae pv. actinidiae]|nr:hypothetical protein PSA5_10195 [Pseudomonas syringae pv. actinidiae]GAO93080.1 hypothetical protein PSA5_10205 [Pseudomonas syringae pv. actinidiae]
MAFFLHEPNLRVCPKEDRSTDAKQSIGQGGFTSLIDAVNGEYGLG